MTPPGAIIIVSIIILVVIHRLSLAEEFDEKPRFLLDSRRRIGRDDGVQLLGQERCHHTDQQCDSE